MPNLGIVAGVIVAVVALDTWMFAVCSKTHAVKPWCRIGLFLLGFCGVFLPVTVVLGANPSASWFIVVLSLAAGVSNGLAVDINNAYFRGRRSE
jgi:hypothetical protein